MVAEPLHPFVLLRVSRLLWPATKVHRLATEELEIQVIRSHHVVQVARAVARLGTRPPARTSLVEDDHVALGGPLSEAFDLLGA